MELITVTIIALGLAMDAFAVSIASGAIYKKLKIKHAFRIALFFGTFQAVMPLIGCSAALTVSKYIQRFDHWLAFALLTAVGIKMIYESFKIKTASQSLDPTNFLVLIVLSAATSIDALAVGFTLSIITSSVITAAIIIGLITFLLSYIGVFAGSRLGHFFESKIEAIGGLVIIAIGLKILIQHLIFL
jgi:putative Mn2+ efflux pump MntP